MAEFPTPTIVRIKRRLGTETSENIIVQAKRKKLSDEPNSPVSDICTTILKKLTTLNQGDSVEIEAKKALLNETKHSWDLKETFKRGMKSSPKDLLQKKSKSEVAAIRFKLICARRDIEDKQNKKSDELDFHLLDALKEADDCNSSILPLCSSSNNSVSDVITCNGVPMISEKIEYVYDLYYTSLPMELSNWIDGICEIQKMNALEFYHGRESDDDSNEHSDEDDENEESNWRNDYPDEEETHLYQDEDDYLCEVLKKTHINDDSDESYDIDDYQEGDFNESGDLICYEASPYNPSVLRKYENSDSSDDDDDE